LESIICTIEIGMISQLKYHKGRLIKRIFTLTLFFSVFSFLGIAGNFNSPQPKLTQIELVYSQKHRVNKRTISYKQAIAFNITSEFLNKSGERRTNILLLHQRLIKISFINNSDLINSILITGHFFQLPKNPQRTSEDHYIPFLG